MSVWRFVTRFLHVTVILSFHDLLLLPVQVQEGDPIFLLVTSAPESLHS